MICTCGYELVILCNSSSSIRYIIVSVTMKLQIIIIDNDE